MQKHTASQPAPRYHVACKEEVCIQPKEMAPHHPTAFEAEAPCLSSYRSLETILQSQTLMIKIWKIQPDRRTTG